MPRGWQWRPSDNFRRELWSGASCALPDELAGTGFQFEGIAECRKVSHQSVDLLMAAGDLDLVANHLEV